MNDCKIIFSILDRSSFDLVSFYILLVFWIVLFTIYYATKKTFLGNIIVIATFFGITYMTIDSFISFYTKINDLKKIYTSKKYKEVVGTISNFKEKRIKAGYVIETFKVKNIEFKFTNIEDAGGYNKTKSEGGILDNHQTVKIIYIDRYSYDIKNTILYLEVCKEEPED